MIELSKKYFEKNEKELGFEDIEILQNLIKYHSDLYYNKQTPIISDFEYDIIFKKLEFLEKKFEIEKKQTSEVGADILESTFEKVAHSRPMISLDNTYNEEDLRDFDERVKKNLGEKDISKKIIYDLEFKFDGLGVELIYKNGELIQAITRGNGLVGEDVTQNVFQVFNIPKKINFKNHLEVRGEIIMPNSVFEKLNLEAKLLGKKIFSNPRNVASGSLRMKDASVTKKRQLKFFAYDIANFTDYTAEKNLENYFSVIKSLEDLGFEISSYFRKFEGIDKLVREIKKLSDLKNKTTPIAPILEVEEDENEKFYKKFSEIDFDIDGLVIKVDEIGLWKDIGWTEHHPRYAIAYKFPAEILTTKVLSVEHSIGRTGTITPVANLEPINIGGVMVKRATLHNYEEIEKLGLKIGDYVFIKRAGEVIPKIISVVDSSINTPISNPFPLEEKKGIFPPKVCPSCGSEVLKDEDKVRFYCGNSYDCPAQHSEKLIFAVGKQGFNIDGLGEKQVELFLDLGIITNFQSIFDLKNKKDEIISLEGFGEKSFTNLVNSIEKAKNIELERFLTSLGISGVGKKTAKTIKKLFKSKDDFLEFSYTLEDLQEFKDVGEELAKNILNYFTDKNHKKFLKEILEILNLEYFIEEKKAFDENNIFAGKKVCITGSFEKNGEKVSRDSLVEILEKNGGEFVGSVSKNTDFLLAGEKAGSKLEKANTLGVKVIDLEYFLENIG